MKKRLLFLCTGNSCRSQMAEGFLKHIGGDKFEAYSAGVNPTQVNPLSVKVMDEVGIDISGQRSKSVAEFQNQQFDYVVTVCDNAKQTCPIFPGECEKIHWNLEDPAQAQGSEDDKIAFFRKIRDEIRQKIEGFKNAPDLQSIIKCPECGAQAKETMPENQCVVSYQCSKCKAVLRPKDGDCCVFCSYGTIKCPPKQNTKTTC